ncbi:unnamed protein product [Prorocentrum cordatum]|uniref:Uncharacterized protein n=1 Tax=Prorocentrum cordatum TaxID=2364126 RepID=A0ABN9WM53_9DINO|nr:unnamed protein product [Polarella glacialis]|mmetsp:Transcript_5037/g.13263  ORF Transcript_5037/g.13263 Transcript_5037/m.13263 type:complete len:224 (-) Transcript_5037:398-1069(-)
MHMPGYTGHVPGKDTGERVSYAVSPAKTSSSVTNQQRVHAAIPGYTGHIGGKTLHHGATYKTQNRQVINKKDYREAEVRPGGAVAGAPLKPGGYPGQGRATDATPGYTGHCPKASAVVGATFASANQKVAKEMCEPRKGLEYRRLTAPNVEPGSPASAGCGVLGYAGHVPGHKLEQRFVGMNKAAVVRLLESPRSGSPTRCGGKSGFSTPTSTSTGGSRPRWT